MKKLNMYAFAIFMGMVLLSLEKLYAFNCCEQEWCCPTSTECSGCVAGLKKKDENFKNTLKNELLRRKAAGEFYNEEVLNYLTGKTD